MPWGLKKAPAPAFDESALHRLQALLAHEDATSIFERADSGKSGDLSPEEFQQMLGGDVDAQLVAQLFVERHQCII